MAYREVPDREIRRAVTTSKTDVFRGNPWSFMTTDGLQTGDGLKTEFTGENYIGSVPAEGA